MRFNQKRYLTPRFILFFLFISFFNKIFAETTSPISEGNFIQRTILSLYFDDKEDAIQYHPIHNLFDMPLHHLGLRVKHWNLAKGIPEHIDMTQIRGLLLYFDANELPDPISFLDWIHPHLKNGKKLVLLGDIGFYQNKKGIETPISALNHFFEHLGLQMAPNSTNETYKFVYDTFEDTRIEFEHKLSANLDPFVSLTKLSSKVDVILSASSRDHPTNSILVCTNENGGYAAQGYFRFKTSSGMTLWRINPFDFFEKAFATVDLPKADTTTLLGNRIFYAHIDGDGWRSVSQVPGYQEKSCNCTKVIEEEIIKKYPHLPLTIAPIVGDLDPKYFGTNEAINQAKEIFAYPQITLGSHSYTHPLDWKFYDDDNANDKEKKIFGDSQNKVEYQNNRHDVEKKVGNGYSLPRSYLYGDFNIEKELLGSIKFISSLAPKNKKVSLFQWSGDCVPFEKALSLLRQKGILNINGGYTRFDPEYPSYAFVGPVGRDEGNEWQIYSSMNNENTYTNNWTGRFYGFRFLVNTFEKTESPIRVKPLNIYYHMYSAEKEAALNLKDNYTYVDQLDKISISTKQFATIANGFFSAEFQKIDENSWLVLNRGKLNEIRFDHATFKEVDWEKSKGVIGQDYYQGSLYMTLDKSDTKPIIALKEAGTIAIEPRKAPKIYVIKSSWRLSNFNSRNAEIRFAAQGYGIGHFTFFCPEPGTYILSSSDKSSLGKNQNVQIKAQTNTQQILKVSIPLNALKPIQLKLSLENQ